jgi:hypothetical protein
MRAFQVRLVPLVVLAALAAACSSSTGSSAQNGDGGTPPGQPRSFRRDVVPIFAQSCASQDCHGDTKNDLGIHFVVADPNAVFAELQRESPTAKGAKFVVAGDPTKSFLYAKVNGDEGDYSAMCAMSFCGETMPPGTKIQSVDRDTIRQWILEGATND